MPDAHTRIDSLKEDIQVIGEMVLDLQARVAAHDRRFDGIDTRLDGIDTRLDGINTRLDDHDARFDHVDAQLAEILSRLPQRPRSGESAN